MTARVALFVFSAAACLGSVLLSPARAEGLGFDLGQFEINAMQGAERLGTSFTMKAEGRTCGDGIRCNWDLDGGVAMWADTIDGKKAVVSAGVGMNTDRRGYSAAISPKVFRDACGAVLSAADPKLSPVRVRQIVTSATDLFRAKSRQRVKEGRLIVIGERHIPGVKFKPDDAYYRCVVEEPDA